MNFKWGTQKCVLVVCAEVNELGKPKRFFHPLCQNRTMNPQAANKGTNITQFSKIPYNTHERPTEPLPLKHYIDIHETHVGICLTGIAEQNI